MKPIVFSNDDETQKVIITSEVLENWNYNIEVDFVPELGKQDRKSMHFRLAQRLINSLYADSEDTEFQS